MSGAPHEEARATLRPRPDNHVVPDMVIVMLEDLNL